MLAPAVSTNLEIFFGSPRSRSATINDVGRVAFEEAVANAVTIASREPRKKVHGALPLLLLQPLEERVLQVLGDLLERALP